MAISTDARQERIDALVSDYLNYRVPDELIEHTRLLHRAHHAIATICEGYMGLARTSTPDEAPLIRAVLGKLADVSDALRALDAEVTKRVNASTGEL